MANATIYEIFDITHITRETAPRFVEALKTPRLASCGLTCFARTICEAVAFVQNGFALKTLRRRTGFRRNVQTSNRLCPQDIRPKATKRGVFNASLNPVLAFFIASNAWLIFLFVPGLPAIAQGQKTPAVSEKADAAFFATKVQPLLQKKCLGCHGVGAKLSGLDLRSREAALKGGTRGAAIAPGSAEKSLLYKLVSGIRVPLMPPGGKLPAAELATLKTWLNGGAAWGEKAVDSAKEQVWWSFKPPVMPKIPAIADAWVRNPIDAFMLTKLKAANLKPSPPAPRRVLIRRAYLDLIGLPPAPEDVRAFEQDTSPKAWEKVVDRLLASPRYGERWGRHWLDLARYADSGGFEGDRDRLLMWRYRDYVISAFNADKPYNDFLREQIAGDELRPNDPEALIATGYLACGPQDIVENNARTRSNELDDLVATTGSVVLGVTIGCARCHDHKYDPIKQTDYYRLSAVFAATERREVECPKPDEKKAIDAHNAPFDAKIQPIRQQLDALYQKGREAAQKAGQANPNDEQIIAAFSDPQRQERKDLLAKVDALEAQKMPTPHAQIVTDKGRDFPACHVLIRGDAYHPGDEVKPGFICSLPGGKAEVEPTAATEKTTGRRRALAEWLVSPQNPLTARVWVNRVWRQHFGRGLVNTPSNFGISGELPSHPELLDWLAVKFQAEGWRLKPLHRLMLLSSTYQQDSAIRPDAMQADPQDRLYWRMPVRRLEAETVRDGILSVAGTLNLEMGGPPVYPPIDPSLRADTFQGPNWQDGKDDSTTWRRSVYVKVKRSLLLPELEVFDCPEITYTVAQRNITTTPLQALTLLNDPLILTQSRLFAERLQKEFPNNAPKQIERAYRLAFGRAPTAPEAKLSLNFIQKRGSSGLQDFCQAIFNLNEFVYAP